jgi:hypothetical protein
MRNSLTLQIAQINFAIHVKGLNVWHEYAPAYQSFVRNVTNKDGDPDVTIQFRFGDKLQRPEKLTHLFDGGQSWFALRDNQDYYFTLNSPDFQQALWIAQAQRDFTRITVYCSEKLVHRDQGKVFLSNPVHYPLDQILLMHLLAQRQGAVLHAAGIDLNGKGYLFSGKSGAGKSTITRLFATRRDIYVFSDDRMVVRKIDGAFHAHGTPWPGDAGIAVNASAPLAGIFFLAQGMSHQIRALNRQQALEKLLPVTSIPWYDAESVPRMLTFCEDLLTQIPAYELSFTPDRKVVEVLEQFVSI